MLCRRRALGIGGTAKATAALSELTHDALAHNPTPDACNFFGLLASPTGFEPVLPPWKKNGVETHVVFTRPGSLTKAL